MHHEREWNIKVEISSQFSGPMNNKSVIHTILAIALNQSFTSFERSKRKNFKKPTSVCLRPFLSLCLSISLFLLIHSLLSLFLFFPSCHSHSLIAASETSLFHSFSDFPFSPFLALFLSFNLTSSLSQHLSPLFLSSFLSLTCTLFFTLSLSLPHWMHFYESLTHTHTHAHTLSLFLSQSFVLDEMSWVMENWSKF